MRIGIDFETRSKIDLRDCGMYKYAEDESTSILCLAVKVEDDTPLIWITPGFRWLADEAGVKYIQDNELQEIINSATRIDAHNAGFERLIWVNKMVLKWGFNTIPFKKWYCTAAKAAYYALPRNLSSACSAIDVAQKKDGEGYNIMMKMSKPRKPSKKNPSIWHEDPVDFLKLCEYCKQDTNAEQAFNKALPDIPEKEIEIWRLDQKINDRGVPVDLKSIDQLIQNVEEKEERLLQEIYRITNGYITSVKQVGKTIEWLATKGVVMHDLKQATVTEWVNKEGIDARAKRILEIRQALAKASVSKLVAMKLRACADGTVKGTLLYAGASTLRWAGKGIQTQNMPRDSFDESTVEDVVSIEDIDLLEMLYDCVFQASSRCVRGMIKAPENKMLICSDYSSIEAIVLAWVAGQGKVLKAVKENKDLYKIAAMDIYKKKYVDVTKDERQIGKVAVLALGYQGWLGAFKSMADNYGVKVDEDRAKAIILQWRDAHPKITAFWRGVEDAAVRAIKTKKVYAYRDIKFGIRGDFLHCRLPSGRFLSYAFPEVKSTTDKWGRPKEQISFMGNGTDYHWLKQFTYGGKLTENIVQAISRDLLAEALIRLDKAGYDVCMHVHDEIVAIAEPNESVEKFEQIMSETPEWAKGCVVSAKGGWIGRRFRK